MTFLFHPPIEICYYSRCLGQFGRSSVTYVKCMQNDISCNVGQIIYFTYDDDRYIGINYLAKGVHIGKVCSFQTIKIGIAAALLHSVGRWTGKSVGCSRASIVRPTAVLGIFSENSVYPVFIGGWWSRSLHRGVLVKVCF